MLTPRRGCLRRGWSLPRLANIRTLNLILATVGNPTRAVAGTRRGVRTPIGATTVELSEKGGVNLYGRFTHGVL